MLTTLTRHYHKLGVGHKFLLGTMFLLGIVTSLLVTIHAENTVDFDNEIPSMFSSWFNSGHYSNTHFKYGGNNVAGIIFWQENETGLSETISINSGAQEIRCTEKLRGIYYNSLRGEMIWPLDTGNYNILVNEGEDYGEMTMSGGFYTNCSAVLGGGYTPSSANEVYGQITHSIGGQDLYMMAGVGYSFTGNSINSRLFTGTFLLSSGVYTLDMFDTYGGIADLTNNMPWCQSLEVTPLSGDYGDGVTLVCYGYNIGGYLLQIFDSDDNLLDYNTIFTGVSPVSWTTGFTLTTGEYTATCTVLDTTGLDPGPSCPNLSFSIGGGTSSSGTALTGTLGFSGYNGGIVSSSGGNYYTNSSGVFVTWSANQNANYTLSGNFTQSPLSGVYTGTSTRSTGIVLSNISSVNTLTARYTTGALSYTATGLIFVDTTPPTVPVISTPTSGTFMCSSTGLIVNRSTSTDTGAGLSGYRYEISSNIAMTGIVASGIVTTGTATISSATISSLAVGMYYIRISAIDMVGNVATGAINNFITSQSYCTQGTGVMIVTSTIHLRNVDLDKVYRSDPIYVFGLTGPALVSVTKGMLFINDATGGATTGVVTSTDALYIELISSDEYDTTVSSYIRVAGLTGTFSLTTKKSNCSLSVGEKLTIQNIYENLKDEYDNDLSKLAEFLHTFQNMVEDESELTNSCTLEYLLQLIEDEFDLEGIDTSEHIAPNCKEYSIGYDPTQLAYYAPEMMNRYYFVNRESLIRHIDYYNPGDCHINTYTNNYRTQNTSDPMRHVAPNGKIYHLIGQYGGFSATEFTSSKYFDSLQAIKMYIDLRNPSAVIWNHTLDTSFTPITYAAPNGKEYKIYKTNRGYMSYKLMKVKYYESLGELKSYINVNNPSRR